MCVMRTAVCRMCSKGAVGHQRPCDSVSPSNRTDSHLVISLFEMNCPVLLDLRFLKGLVIISFACYAENTNHAVK